MGRDFLIRSGHFRVLRRLPNTKFLLGEAPFMSRIGDEHGGDPAAVHGDD